MRLQKKKSSKKTQSQAKNPLFGILVEFFQKIGENNEFFFTICKKNLEKLQFLTKTQRKNSKLKDFSKNSSQKTISGTSQTPL